MILLALLVVWLVFSVIKKLFGLALLIALAIGAWFLWTNPALLQDFANAAMGMFG